MAMKAKGKGSVNRAAPALNVVTDLRQGAPGVGPGLGACLRGIRARLGLTLNEVSARTGIASSTLSRAENEKISLTYAKIVRLHKGLGIELAELFEPRDDPTPSGPVGLRVITRAGEGRASRTPAYQRLRIANEVASRTLSPAIVTPNARSLQEFGKLTTHEGEEYSYVLKGVVEWHSAFYEPVRLESGDSIYFNCRMPHAYLNAGRGEAQFLCVITTPVRRR
jgi:transcriptional regulator with XRE-family HTH domain